MATKKISALEAATALANADTIPIVQSGATKKASVDVLFTQRRFQSSKKVATIGTTEILTADGTFDTNAGWTIGAGWAISGGKATHSAGTTALTGTSNMANAKVYRAIIVLSGVTGGSINVWLGGASQPTGYNLGLVLNATGTHTIYGICGTGSSFIIVPTNDFVGSIESITLNEFARSNAEFSMDAGSGRPHEFRTGNDGGNLGIGEQAVSCVQLDYAFVGVKDSSGPAGPYRGNNNMGIGNRCLASVVTGKYNVAVGQESMLCLTTGYNNTGMGDSVMNNITNGYDNAGFGYEVLGRITRGFQNTGLGSQAGYALTTANDNTLIGYGSGVKITIGNYNTGIGSQTLASMVTGSSNTMAGWNAGALNTGSSNTIIGANALEVLASANQVTAIGCNAGRKTLNNRPVTDYRFVLIGYNTGRTVASATELSNYIGIGYEAEVSASNQTVIGNSSMAEVYLGSVSGAAKLFCSKVRFTAIPTSSSGLSAGDVWSNNGVLTIV